MIWKVVPVGVCAWVIERRPSISLRVLGSICLEWRQRSCVTLGKKAEWRAVSTEYTYDRSLQSFLGRGDVNPVKGEQPLEFSLDRIFPSLRDSYILKTNNGGPLFEDPMYFPFTPLVAMWTYIPCYCSLQCVGDHRAGSPKIPNPFGWEPLVGVCGIELQPALPPLG